MDTDYDIIWVRLELLIPYAKWISIHFQREVSEAINGYKLAKAAGSAKSEPAKPKRIKIQDMTLDQLYEQENHTFCEEGYFAKRRLQSDSAAVL